MVGHNFLSVFHQIRTIVNAFSRSEIDIDGNNLSKQDSLGYIHVY